MAEKADISEELIFENDVVNTALLSSDDHIIAVARDDIISCSYDIVTGYFGRLAQTRENLISSRNSVNLFFPEYAGDEREIVQIPEIMNWFRNSLDCGIPWFYFLDTDHADSLHFLAFACCGGKFRVKEDGLYYTEYEN